MVKTEEDRNQKNKVHKTLRDKLKKKREELKNHKKEKREKHKQYNSEEEKKKFFDKKNRKKRDDGIKQYKLRRHIERFIDIYEDDVEDFYELFKVLDEEGLIDIGDVENVEMQKCLKKIFKYLPLKKKKSQYKKKANTDIKLQPLLRQLVSQAIENYLQNGTNQDKHQQQSSEEEKPPQIPIQLLKQKQLLQPTVKNHHQQLEELQNYKLYCRSDNDDQPNIGPSIPQSERQKLIEMFEEQMKKGNAEQNEEEEGNGMIERIFELSTKKVDKKAKPNIDDIPQHLLAEGSAKIGQKQQIDNNQIEEYDKIHRPKKLIDMHQEMKQIGKYSDERKNKERVPFNRQRDIVSGGRMMNNGVFFDFKDKMTKPKGTNNFL